MRIAQLANFVGPVSGGMKTAVDQLGRGYVAAGHERILVVPGPKAAVTETEAGIEVQVRAPRVAGGYRMIFQPWQALAALERFNPTSVEVSDKWTLSPVAGWARRRGIGSVLFSHERLDHMLALWMRRQAPIGRSVRLLNRRLAKSFDAVVVTSAYAAVEFQDIANRLARVPLGVDLETFAPVTTPADDGVLKLIYVGRMSREKHPHLSVLIARELHRRGVDVHLEMCGEGPDLDELRELAGSAPVTFSGFVGDRAEVARRLASADVSLSVSPAETFGLAVLEALACGTPVVTSDLGGAFEIVREECGEWDDPDPRLLANAVQRLVARDRASVRAAARARAERYPWSRSVERMLALHADLSA